MGEKCNTIILPPFFPTPPVRQSYHSHYDHHKIILKSASKQAGILSFMYCNFLFWRLLLILGIMNKAELLVQFKPFFKMAAISYFWWD